jgi:hypothetical protein
MAKVNVTLEQIVAAIESGEYRGFCLACGQEHDGVEPDALARLGEGDESAPPGRGPVVMG